MSQHYRAQIRNATRLALEHCSYFSDFTHMAAWASGVDITALPVLAVMTPSDIKGDEARGSSERLVTLQLLIRRAGGEDIEDQLDLDSAQIEIAVLAALRTQNWGGALTKTEISVDHSGAQRIGMLDMQVQVTLWVPEPLTS